MQVIRQDDFGGAKDLTRHIIEKETDSIWFLVPALEWPAITERERGIRSAIREAFSKIDFQVIACGDGSFSSTAEALSRHFNGGNFPRVVMGGNDQMGIAALKWLQGKGLRIPEDVRVTGYNAFEAWEYTTPSLTTVFSPAYEMGAKAGESILARLYYGKFEIPELVLPVRLQVGESS
jgi:LacI family transcriptional regulator